MTNKTIDYRGQRVVPLEGESVLDSLLRVGADISFSCRGGVCHTCLVSCTAGPVPVEAQRGLPQHLVDKNYLLACRCKPVGSMQLAPKRPEDMLMRCALVDVSADADGRLLIQFESMSRLDYQLGQTVRLVTGESFEPQFRLVSDPQPDSPISAVLEGQSHPQVKALFKADFEFGLEFTVRGPFPVAATNPAEAVEGADEVVQPAPDPALWKALGHGAVVRAVLEAFYAKVYQDPQLAPFFQRVTIERSIEKQYSFLKQCMTGEKIYFGDRPRNAHHWMIISDEMFNYRQQIMIETLREHGVADELIARWTAFEEPYRRDIVKASAWPRRLGGIEIDTERFTEETLGVDALCDHCGDEVGAGTKVLYHMRLGQISCPSCKADVAQEA